MPDRFFTVSSLLHTFSRVLNIDVNSFEKYKLFLFDSCCTLNCNVGATIFSIMTLSIATLSILVKVMILGVNEN